MSSHERPAGWPVPNHHPCDKKLKAHLASVQDRLAAARSELSEATCKLRTVAQIEPTRHLGVADKLRRELYEDDQDNGIMFKSDLKGEEEDESLHAAHDDPSHPHHHLDESKHLVISSEVRCGELFVKEPEAFSRVERGHIALSPKPSPPAHKAHL